MCRAGGRCVLLSLCIVGVAWSQGATPGSAWEEAILGHEPYAEIMAEPFPLPPSLQEVQTLPPAEFVCRQTAIKQVLLGLHVRALSERKRVSDTNLLTSARLAEKLNAPEQVSAYFRLLASDTLGNRQRYLVQSALDTLLRNYLVDELALRYFVELSAVSEKELEAVLSWLPVESCFNMAAIVNDAERVSADYAELQGIYTRLHALYAAVCDRASADASADAALEFVILHNTTAYTRLYAPLELKNRVAPQIIARLVAPSLALQNERHRLRENDYYGSLRLRLIDLLLG